MLTLLVTIGIIWIVLRVLLFFVELPFRILGFVFSLPCSTFFWLFWIAVLIALVL